MKGITTNRLNEILNYNYYSNTNNKKDYVFEANLTVDNRYVIICDDVIDIKEQRRLGNIWDSIDVLKTIFSNVNVNDREYKIIQENQI